MSLRSDSEEGASSRCVLWVHVGEASKEAETIMVMCKN